MKEIFKQEKLPYRYDSLEPYIDMETMETHFTKHHAGYVKKLNAAVNDYEELHNKTIEGILSDISIVPDEIEQAVINNGGGHANHTLFWNIMNSQGGDEPTGKLANDIKETFGSFEGFKEDFEKAAASRFGSGWAWLVIDENGKLQITATANQDSPLMNSLTPILGLDVWEHAYYLKYKNKRDEYINNWWNVVYWDKVGKLYEQALQ